MSIEQDYIDLFTGTRKAHMAKYVYMYRPYIYEDILRQDAYYPFKMESNLLTQTSKEICKNFQGITHVLEMGPGSHTAITSKTVPFLRALKEHIGFSTYKAIDATLEYAEEACKIIENHFNNIKTQALEVDFLSTNAFQIIENELHPNDKKLMISFGQYIFGNSNDTDIEVLIGKIGSFLNKNDYLLFGTDTNQDEALLESAYSTKMGQELLLNAMYYLKFTLNLKNFSPEAFEHMYRWNSQERTVELLLKATTDQAIKIRNKSIIIDKGQEFNILNSRKPSIETVKKYLAKENIVIKNVISSDMDKANKFSIVIAEKMPSF
ncbi:L-histidine N(alpha)-methyltransferase [Candidatus Paracaedibacter symbiosus]|uniref:L-histidine N(alpha)-methyltransferase n=1 Tax=Candidatus Paracaedibacter symbiosus TaxID=244582 RepID=UPI000509A7D3|nr:L-histidine N(alpha)-methyltransferase [Candidatus Paracaedibacter symbiosus]